MCTVIVYQLGCKFAAHFQNTFPKNTYGELLPSRGVLIKWCSENMQQIYRRTPMPKYDFIIKKETLAQVFPINFAKYLRTPFL